MHGLTFRLSALILGFCLVLISACGFSDKSICRDDITALNNGANNVKAETVYIVLDNSGSMGEQYKNQQKTAAARKILYRLNRVFPDRMNAGLRSFGEDYFGFESTKLDYGIAKFCCWDFGKAVQSLGAARGSGNLESALRAAGEDIKNQPGRIALIILSDGKQTKGDPVKAVADLKAQLGPRLCIHAVQLGNDRNGAEMLSRISSAGQCGSAVNADNLRTEDSIKSFFNNLFPAIKKSGMPKSDRIISEEKKIVPETKPDAREKSRKKVKSGKVFLRLQVLFDNGKADIKPVYFDEIKKVADFMKQYPDIKVAIEGHTDSLGKLSMNMRLSRQRAEAVIQELVEKHGIESSRIKAVGYGPKRPIASNATEKGRGKNRRVEARRVSN